MQDARTKAYLLLNQLDEKKFTLDYLLDNVADEPDGKNELDRRDRGLFNALIYGVLRQRSQLDYVIKQFSNTPFNKIDSQVRNILRLALYQIMFMDRVPNSAAVNTAVNLAKRHQPKAQGFINAVLRKSTDGWQSLSLPDYAKLGLPDWLIKRWQARFGEEGLVKIATNLNQIPPLSLRVNTLKTTSDELKHQLANFAESISYGEFSNDVINLTKAAVPVFELPGFIAGFFQVQDEAAQLAVALVDPQPNETILDVCAGIGGKTCGMGILAHNRAQITATDTGVNKLARINDEITRLGLNPVKTQVVDWLQPLAKIEAVLDNPKYDKVLVDAPCTGLGVLRRNPDTKWMRVEKDVFEAAKRQQAILHNAAAFVKLGGALVYTVCSTEPEETTAVVETFLNNNPNFVVTKTFATYPDYPHLDGFFMAHFTCQK